MKKIPLTPEQKKWKQKRDNLQGLHNRVLTTWSFQRHLLKTHNDFWTFIGLKCPEKEKCKEPITIEEIRSIFEQQKQQLEKEIHDEQSASTSAGNTLLETTRPSIGNDADKQTSSEKPTNERSPVPPSSELAVERRDEKTTSENNGHLELLDKDAPIASKRVLSQAAEEFVQNERNNYGLKPSPNESKELFWYWHQKKALADIEYRFNVKKLPSLLLVAGTGTGKTYIGGGFLRRRADENYGVESTFAPSPYVYITRVSIVEQSERVMKRLFNLDLSHLEVINIEQLRSKAGRLWVMEKMEIINGKETWFWKWKIGFQPIVLLIDESQAERNEDSTQSEILAGYNDLPKTIPTLQLRMSATPFTRVSEAKNWAVSTRRNIEHLGFPKGTILTNTTWPAYAAAIASPAKPYEYDEKAVERLMKDLEEYVVRVKGVKPQFDAVNRTELIDFHTDEERKYYVEAWDRYVEEKKRLEAIRIAEGKDPTSTGLNELVAFQKFRMAAEYCRREYLAKEMYEGVTKRGKAMICALNFKATIIAVTKILVQKYKVSRSEISLIWGGGQTELTEKQKNKKKIMGLKDKLEAAGMSVEEMLESLGLDNVEDRIVEELDPSLRLGVQSKEDRQIEIDRFQSGKSTYCFFTFRAGGVGLSLHHTDEFTEYKVRRKESGYAVEEDIPNVPIRPRESLIAPTYSAIELVQGLGRAPRLTSLSHTLQRLIFYRHSIEKDVAAIVSIKLKCLGPVVKQKESWMSVTMTKTEQDQYNEVQKHLAEVTPTEEDEDGLIPEDEG